VSARWRSWDLGSKVVFTSACACLLTLFLPWLGTPVGAPRLLTDMPVGSPFVLLILYGVPLAYPVLKLWSGGTLHKGVGIGSAVLGLLLAMGLGSNLVNSFPVLYRLESGYHFYILSMLGLAAGVLLYRPAPAPSKQTGT
jgi:hypothetical protein